MLGRTMRIAGLFLLLLPVLAQAETRLESLVWEDGVLILGFDGPYESRSMVLDDPHRIVMDFPEVHSDLQRHVYTGSGELESIRVGQNEPDETGGLRVRVVMDLASSHNFLSEQAGNYLRVVLSPGSGEDLGVQVVSGAQSAPVIAAEAAPEAVPVTEPAPVVMASTEADEEPYELPMFAESSRLPAPPPASAPELMPAGLGAINPLAAPPAAETPVQAAELPAPDLSREDPAPIGWEDSVNAEFSRLFAGSAEASAGSPAMLPTAGPLDDLAMAATSVELEVDEADPVSAPEFDQLEPVLEPAVDSPVALDEPVGEPISVARVEWAEPEPAAVPETVATESEAVFFGDPFEVVEDAPAEPVFTTADATPVAPVKMEDEQRAIVKVEARLPEPEASSESTRATPVGKPVILGAAMGAASDWEVSVSAAPAAVPSAEATMVEQVEYVEAAPIAAEPVVETSPAPVVTFTRRENEPEVNAIPDRAIMQVASAELPRKSAQVEEKPDREAAMRLAMMAGHNRVKPDEANISLEMRGAEFGTLLRAFSEFAGINIIAGREVKGKVSVNLKEVPWREALSAVCIAHGYSVKEEHGLLRVAPLSSLIKEEMELLTAQKKRREYRPLHTEVVKLSYAVAGEIVTPLSRMLGERGKMDVDSRTNSLLITDLPEAVEQMVALAKTLDHQIPQVEITARIVDVDYAASRELGIKWEALNLVNSSAGLVGSGGIDGTFPAPVGEFKMAKVHDWGEINVTLQAMEKENKANIISNPRVMTMDNREASILVGKKIPLIVADEAGNAVTQLTTIGIKLVVTPHINPDGRIVMDVLTEVSDLASEATVQGGVIITTSESKTNVMVDDNETAVIAGLLKASDSKLDTEVPLLGKIPFLGKLFGYNNKSESKRELVIFITPRVISTGGGTTASELSELGYTIPTDG
jgi:type IV pilus assembly protein PilQ